MGVGARVVPIVVKPRRRQWLAVVLVSGLLGGAAIAAGTAARRTATAYPRMLQAGHIADADVTANGTVRGMAYADKYLDAVGKLPQVASRSGIAGLYVGQLLPDGRLNQRLNTGTALVSQPTDDRTYASTELLRPISGRLPNPHRPDEIAINEPLAEATGWQVGSRPPRLRLFPLSALDSDLEPVPKKGIPLSLTVVGIVRAPTDLLAGRGAGEVLRGYVTHAFALAHPDTGYYRIDLIHLRDHSDLAEFRTAVEKVASRFPGITPSVVSIHDGAAFAETGLRPQEYALWALAGGALLVAILLLAQGSATRLRSAVPEMRVMRALGLSRAERRRVNLSCAALAATATAVIASGVGYLLSPLGPIDSARQAEPHPGFASNLALYGAGAGLIICVATALASLPSARLARHAETIDVPLATASSRRSRAARTRLGAAPAVGIRLALEPGRPGNGANSRPALAAVCAAIVAATAAVVFVANLEHLTGTPREYGWNWTAAVGTPYGALPDGAIHQMHQLDYVSDGSGATLGLARIGSTVVPGIGIHTLKGSGTSVTLRSGRLPQTPDEIVMGSRSLAEIHSHVGATISAVTGGKPRRLRIVGVATFPPIGLTRFQEPALGRGLAGMASLFPQGPDSGGTYNYFLMNLKPGGAPKLNRFVAQAGCPDLSCVQYDGRPTEIRGYARARALTWASVAVLGAALLVALARAISGANQRRKHDFALLKSLGMTRRQLSAVVAWQSATIAAIGALIGIPLGVASGRILWSAFAGSLGAASPTRTYLIHVGLTVSTAVAATALVGAVSAVLVRRVTIASELRTEQ